MPRSLPSLPSLLSLGASLVLATGSGLALGAQAALIPAVVLAVVAPWLVTIDVAEHRLPNRLVVPTLAAGIIALAMSWAATGDPPFVPALAGVIGGATFFLLALAGGVGMGDAKLAAALGLASPTVGVAMLSPLLAFTLGGVAAVVVMVRRGRHAQLAFGPFLLAGYFGTLLLGAVARML